MNEDHKKQLDILIKEKQSLLNDLSLIQAKIDEFKQPKEALSKSNNDEIKKKELIVMTNLYKTFGSTKVLKGIDLKIYEEDRVAIVGPNGAGKTTLVEIIAKIKEASSGTIKYSFGKTKKEISKNIGIQFQETTFPPQIKVKTIITFFQRIYKSNLTKEQVKKYMQIFNVTDIYNKTASKLSGGQKQKLNAMLSIINRPKLLILDEVGTGLDVETWTKIKYFVRNYLDKTHGSLIIISHRSDEIELFANRIVVIKEGKIARDDSTKDIIDRYGSVEKYLNSLYARDLNKTFVEGVKV